MTSIFNIVKYKDQEALRTESVSYVKVQEK